jgi:hypothetical protein
MYVSGNMKITKLAEEIGNAPKGIFEDGYLETPELGKTRYVFNSNFKVR